MQFSLQKLLRQEVKDRVFQFFSIEKVGISPIKHTPTKCFLYWKIVKIRINNYDTPLLDTIDIERLALLITDSISSF